MNEENRFKVGSNIHKERLVSRVKKRGEREKHAELQRKKKTSMSEQKLACEKPVLNATAVSL